jgi:hypothetical protein
MINWKNGQPILYHRKEKLHQRISEERFDAANENGECVSIESSERNPMILATQVKAGGEFSQVR